MPRADAKDASRRNQKWAARRESIIDTSARLFAANGYHATAIHDRVMDEVMLGADRVAAAGGNPPDQLTMLGGELLDVIHRYPDHVWVFLHEFPALTGERAATFRERRREYERRVEGVLQAGVESGEFRELDPWLTA